MTKNLLKASLWGILTLSLFYSCRTDSVTTEQNQQISEKITAFERFEKANNIIQPKASSTNDASSEKYVSYAAPFSEVITNFLEKHSDYRKRLEKEIGKIRLDVSSTTFGEGAKGVLFPVTDKDGKVIGAWGGIVNEERDYVKFYYLNNSSQEVTSIKNAFQSYYDRNTGKLVSLAIASKSASLNPIAKKATDIEEVVITVYKPLTYYDLPSWWHDAGWTDPTKNPGPGPGTTMEGGPGTHGGGTNGTENNNQQKDPCSGMKTQRDDKGFKDGVTDLKGKTGLKKETGYTQNGTTGEYTYQENASATESSNSLRLPDAERYNVKSYLHTHVDDFSTTDDSGNEVTRTGIKMFSPADVIYMMDMLRNAKTRGIDFSDVSGTMVTSIGTYTLRFSGNEYQLKSFTFEQYQGYTTSYIDFMTSNTNLSLEQKFLQFIDTKMNVKGIELFKLNDDGTNTKISLNSDKSSVTTSNCPN